MQIFGYFLMEKGIKTRCSVHFPRITGEAGAVQGEMSAAPERDVTWSGRTSLPLG